VQSLQIDKVAKVGKLEIGGRGMGNLKNFQIIARRGMVVHDKANHYSGNRFVLSNVIFFR
jgi:hypothetical protein